MPSFERRRRVVRQREVDVLRDGRVRGGNLLQPCHHAIEIEIAGGHGRRAGHQLRTRGGGHVEGRGLQRTAAFDRDNGQATAAEAVELAARDGDIDRLVRGVGAEHVVAGVFEADAQRVEIRGLDADAVLGIVTDLSGPD